MDQQEKIEKITNALLDKKGTDIVVLNLSGQTIVADYFVIATGRNAAQVNALSENVDEELSKIGCEPNKTEGLREGKWAILDYGDRVVKVFEESLREYYTLDKLWDKGDNVTKIN